MVCSSKWLSGCNPCASHSAHKNTSAQHRHAKRTPAIGSSQDEHLCETRCQICHRDLQRAGRQSATGREGLTYVVPGALFLPNQPPKQSMQERAHGSPGSLQRRHLAATLRSSQRLQRKAGTVPVTLYFAASSIGTSPQYSGKV